MHTKIIDENIINCALEHAMTDLAFTLRPDILSAIKSAKNTETNKRAKEVLNILIKNASIAKQNKVALCQDTGSVYVLLEIGEKANVALINPFKSINKTIRKIYKKQHLRMSIVKDAIVNRSNTNSNTPIFYDIKYVPGTKLKLNVMLKGGGSDNASKIEMLPPSTSNQTIKEIVLEHVINKASNACPPVIVGIGIGATFDKVAGLSKRALFIKQGKRNANDALAKLEIDLLKAINSTNIGPAALGGKTTALDVHILSDACHIAAKPLAINLGCCAMRSTSIDLNKFL